MERSNAEENAIILDYLKNGYAMSGNNSFSKAAVAQALGTEHLTILELVPKKDIFLQPMQEVYIGEGKREEIHHTKGRIPYDKLTTTARTELEHAIEKLVGKSEDRFIEFFNKAQPLSLRMHQLELLPGLGKKHMNMVISARAEKLFEGFDDLKNRVKLLPDPKSIIVKRIISEIKGKEKYRIFTKP